MASSSSKQTKSDTRRDEISIYRRDDVSRVLAERASRIAEELLFSIEGAMEAAERAVEAGEMHEEILDELREVHGLVRRRALHVSPQGRLI